MQIDIEMLDTAMSITLQMLTPMILAGGTLLAMASVRNSDIASRSRSCKEELLYKNPPLGRRRKLKDQIKKFNNRYIFLSVVSSLFSIGLFFCMIIAVLNNFNEETKTQNFLLLTSSVLFVVGLLVLLSEFCRGHGTLELNSKSD
jgi:hypothetical protein